MKGFYSTHCTVHMIIHMNSHEKLRTRVNNKLTFYCIIYICKLNFKKKHGTQFKFYTQNTHAALHFKVTDQTKSSSTKSIAFRTSKLFERSDVLGLLGFIFPNVFLITGCCLEQLRFSKCKSIKSATVQVIVYECL